jgi:hypothetical protein
MNSCLEAMARHSDRCRFGSSPHLEGNVGGYAIIEAAPVLDLPEISVETVQWLEGRFDG